MIIISAGLCLLALIFCLCTPVFADDIEAVLDSADGSSGLSIQDSGTAEVMRVDSDGNATISGSLEVQGSNVFLPGPNAAPVDGAFDNSQWTIWLDEGSNEFEFKAKKSDGTVISQTVSGGGATDLDGLSDVNSSTVTGGRLLIADGTSFESMQLQGDCTLNGAGFIDCSVAGGATQLDALSDVNSATVTAGRLLIADGTEFESMQLQGDATMSGAGFITIADDAITASKIATAAVGSDAIGVGAVGVSELADINSATKTAGRLLIADGTDFESMQLQGDCTMNGAGYITCSVGGGATQLDALSDVNSATITAGRLLIADGTEFESMQLQGDCTLNGAGYITCTGGSGATELDELSDVNSATITAGRLLIADGTEFESMQLQGDATMDGAGFITVADDAITAAKIAANAVGVSELAEFNSLTVTAGRLLIADGTDFESMQLQGDCTMSGAGYITCTGGSGATQLDALSDVNSATITAGRLLIADGTGFESMQLQGDATMNGAGFITIGDDTITSAKIATDAVDVDELANINSLTVTAGRLLVSDGTDFESMLLQGDCTINGAGFITCTGGGGATQLDGLSDVNSATITAGRLLIADGTEFESMQLQGDCTMNGAGYITCTGGSGATQLDELNDINSATITAGRLLIADGTDFESMQLQGDATMDGAGFIAIIDDAITSAKIMTDAVDVDELANINSLTVTAGRLLVSDGTDFESMLLQGDCTINGAGFITCTGGGGATQLDGLSDVNSATVTAGRLLIADGTEFESMQLQGDCTVNGAGFITCTGGSGATQLDELNDINSATITAGRLLIADGTEFESMQLQGDATMDGAGFITIADDAITASKIATAAVGSDAIGVGAVGVSELADINSATKTAGRLLIADGTDFESMQLQGDCTMNGAGYITCTGGGGATQLDGLSDVNSATITAGRLLIADGTEFESMQLQGDATMDGAGFITIANDAITSAKIATDAVDVDELANINSLTVTAGRLLVSDGTDFESMLLQGDCTINGAGFITCTGGGGATQLDGLSDVNSATITAGRLLIADGTEFESMQLQGDCTMNGAGYITCTGGSGATQLDELNDINSATITAGRLLIADGTEFESMQLQGDATMDGAGFITIADDAIIAAKIATDAVGSDAIAANAVDSSEIAANAVGLSELADINSATKTAGRLLIADGTDFESMQLQGDCTMNGAGYITCTGGGGATQLDGLSDVNSATIAAGRLLIADGTEFESMQLQGDCTMNGAGYITCTGGGGATQLDGLSDVNSATITAGRLLIADGTEFESMQLQGDAMMDGAGFITIANDAITSAKIATDAVDVDELANINSLTVTAGRLLVSDGTDFESMLLQGDCTINGAGFIDCSASAGATQLDSLSDVNSSTITAGRLLIADGTEFESMQLQGDATMDGAGFITIADDAITAVKIETNAVGSDAIAANAVDSSEIAANAVGVSELADINSATKTAGRLLIADGTEFESMQLQGDCSLNGAGFITCTSDGGATQLDELNDINSSTITAGRLLIADGTEFESMQLQGDATVDGAGFITIADDAITSAKIATDAVDVDELANINSLTVTAGRLLVSDGTDFESMLLQGDCTINGTGFIDCSASAGATQLDALNDVNSATITAGRLLIADGTDFESMAMIGDATLSGSGALSLSADSVDVDELTLINSLTVTAGRLLVADGTDFESMALQGDCTINGAGFIDCSGSAGATQLDALNDVNSATITAGRLLIADGTEFESMQLQGDATMNGAGFITIADDAITSAKIATAAVGSDAIGVGVVGVSELADINSATKTAGRLLIADGTDFESMALQGDCTMNGAGFITCSSGGATQLDALSDVNSATVTAGRLLIADGTEFESMQLQGDATMDGAGFVTIADDAITSAKIATNAVDSAAIAANAVDSSEITANAIGVSELADINSATKTAGRLLIADGTEFESMQLQGDCSLNGAGYITCVSDGGATQLDELNDINSATITAGRLLIADGTEFESMQLQGDATMDGAGFITIADDAITAAKIETDAVGSDAIAANAVGVSELANINSLTVTAGRLLVSDGTDFESMLLQGDCTINGAGFIDCSASAGATQLDALSDVNSATITAGRLLIADGTEFESMQLQGDATMDGAGFITIADDAITAAKIATDAVGSDAIVANAVGVSELANINSLTVTAGRLLVSDGTDFESMLLQGDCTINGAGFIDCSASAGATQLDELSDVNSATITAGRLLIADGTEFESMQLQGDATMDGAGFVTIADDAITAAKIATNAVDSAEIAANAVDSSEIAASAVGVSELADINSATKTAGRLLIADGTEFESMQLQGDCTLNGAGFIDCSASAGATQLDALNDVNSATITAGRLLIADGTEFESMQLQGDAAMDGAGFITIADDAITSAKIETNAVGSDAIAANAVDSSEIAANAVGVSELADINSATKTAGRLLIADGTEFESMQLQGDCSLNGAGFITCVSDGGATQLDELNDVNSATITAGRLLIADGTEFESMQLQGDATMDGAGFITIADDAITSAKIATDAVGSDAIAANAVGVSELTNINSLTVTAGRLLVSDGTDFESMLLQGDCTINGAGFIDCSASAGATQLDALNDVNSATITAGRLLIADGTEFESMQLQGDATMDGAGFVTIADDAITAAKIATNAVDSAEIAANAVDSSEIAANAVGVSELADINSATKTAGRLLIADGTEFESMQLQGDCTLNGAGFIDCSASAGATQLDALNDVNSATITAGRLLIADGTEFESMQLQGDAAMDGAGFITIADDAITSAKIETNAVGSDAIAANAVDSSEIAANAVGVSELADINSATKTAGRLLIADGTEFESMQLQGDCSLNGAGYITCVSDGGATQLDELNDINSATITAGRLLIADGTEFESMQLQGDATMDGAGFITIADDAITSAKIETSAVDSAAIAANAVDSSEITANAVGVSELADINSATKTAGRLLIADGTEFESMQLQGDCSLNGAGYITCVSDGGATQLDELNDINSATITAGRLLIADGTEFESMQLQGDATMDGAGFITIADDAITAAKIETDAVGSDAIAANAVGVSELANINSLTSTAGRLLVSDGTDFESMLLQGDCTINGAGFIDCSASAGATQLDALSDVNSATITAGRLLIADGTAFESMQLQGDATMDGAGFITIADDAITAAKIATDAVGSDAIVANAVGVSELANINSLTVTAGRLLVSDGTDFESMLLQGDCTINGAGFIDCSASAGATQLDELSDVNSATITAGRLLIADGTEFESMQLQGDATMDGAGFVTIADDAITAAKIATNAVDSAEIAANAVDSSEIAASAVGVSELADINSATKTAGRLLIADGTDFESMALQGDCTISGAGFIDCSASAGATQLDALNDVNSATITAGRLLIADGTEFESMQLQGDATMNGAGFITIADDAITAAKIATNAVDSAEIAANAVDSSEITANAVGVSELADINSATKTAGRLLIADGTDFESMELQGDCSLNGAGFITCVSDGGATQLDELNDVNSATITAGRLLIADGTEFESMQLQGDATMDGAGFLTLAADSVGSAEIAAGAVDVSELANINSLTVTAGRLLVSDGTDFESMLLQGDCTINGAGFIDCSASAGATQLDALNDVNSATITAGRLLIADGTEFESMQLQGDCTLNGAGFVECSGISYLTGDLGIGTTGPNSSLHVQGSLATKVTTVTNAGSPYTVLATDQVIICDATAGGITIDLPAAAGATGRRYEIKKVDSSGNAITIDGSGGETLDGTTTVTISVPYESVTIVSDGAEWWII